MQTIICEKTYQKRSGWPVGLGVKAEVHGSVAKIQVQKGEMLICNKNMSCLGCMHCVSCFDTEEAIASDCNGKIGSNVKKHKAANAP